MLKRLSLMALLGIATVGVPCQLAAKSVKVASLRQGVSAKVVTRRVAQQNVTIEFYSPSIVRIVKCDANQGASVQKKSYSVVLKPRQTKDIQIEEKGEIVNIKSSLFSAKYASFRRMENCCLPTPRPARKHARMKPTRASTALSRTSAWPTTRPSMAWGSCVMFT